ncbi:MAG TPA: SCO family protein [Acidobacteriaceae bacterium]|jgi:protein SCO1/2|nr:SCO family protein [Acidobacteriaceae bacterium]
MRVRSSCAWLLVAIAAIAFGMTGCRGTVNAPAGNKNTSQSYPVRGVVVGSDPASGEVILKHDDVPGLMPAMTMPYHLEDPSALSELHAGDLITATLLADHDAAGPINLRLKNIVVISQARPDYKPAVNYHVPAKGDEVPDFKLHNQSNHAIDLKQFRGKVVVMTFIYTRCPLADFCPRMSHNFAEIDKTLQADPALYKNTHLLSVSFDPTYDTPKVLRSYGAAYTGNFTKERFQHWEFAAPSVADLPSMEQFFDVGVTPGENGTLQHSLSTVVIGKDGKIVAFYPTNDWTPAEVLAEVHSAAS